MSPKSRFAIMIAGVSFVFAAGIVAMVSTFLLEKAIKTEVYMPKKTKLNVKDVNFFKK